MKSRALSFSQHILLFFVGTNIISGFVFVVFGSYMVIGSFLTHSFSLQHGLLAFLLGLGVLFLVTGLKKWKKRQFLCEKGHIAEAILVDKKPTPLRLNKRRLYLYTFQFTDSVGQTHQFVQYTRQTHSLEDDQAERILYDPKHPTNALVIDTLPIKITK